MVIKRRLKYEKEEGNLNWKNYRIFLLKILVILLPCNYLLKKKYTVITKKYGCLKHLLLVCFL